METAELNLAGARPAHVKTWNAKIERSGIVREEWWDPELGRHEVTFALNPFERRLVLFRGARGRADDWKKGKRWTPQRWVTGTIDWYGRLFGLRWIDDLKTGAFPVSVFTSKQVRTYALVAWFEDGCPFKWECKVSITQWSKYPLDALPKREFSTLTGFDMMEHLADVCWALEHPNEINPVWYFDENGKALLGEFGEKLPVCSGCPARVAHPASGWMQNFWHRAMPTCWDGALRLISG